MSVDACCVVTRDLATDDSREESMAERTTGAEDSHDASQ